MTNELKVIICIGAATLLLFLGAVFLLGNDSSTEEQSAVNIDAKNATHKKGSENAPVTIVEFGDFQCPSCAAMHPVIQKLLAEYDGKIQFVYRHFPLPQHRSAVPAIQAAEAAHEQNKFWEMYALLYERQSEWNESSSVKELFISYAKELGLDTSTFQADFGSGKYEKLLQADLSEGNRLGVNSTPTLYVNNVKVFAQNSNYEGLKKMIDEILKK